jgi:hypothetical protein
MPVPIRDKNAPIKIFSVFAQERFIWEDINPEIPRLFRIMVVIVPVQNWMARMALGWGVRDLACAAEVSPATVKRFECGESLRVPSR